MNISIRNGNVIDELKKLPSESVDCIVSSPPYYSLRDYSGVATYSDADIDKVKVIAISDLQEHRDRVPDPQKGRYYLTEPLFNDKEKKWFISLKYDVSEIWGGDPDCDHEWIEYVRKGQDDGRNSDKLNIKKSNEENFQLVENQKQNVCSKCGAWAGQLGLEPTYQMYIDHMMLVMTELKRILKKTGTLFWNMGDSYASSGGPSRHFGYSDPKWDKARNGSFEESTAYDQGIEPKSLMMMPERLAMAMIDDGWILRNTLSWHKCLGSNTQLYVKTSTGTFRTNVKDLYKIKGEKYVYGTKGWIKITNFVKNPTSDMLTIHLRNGMRIEVTPEHRFPLEDGRLLCANDLKKGDKIAHNRLADNKGSELGTYDNGYIVGMYVAEGCKTKRMIQIALHAKENDIADKIKKFTLKYDGTFGNYNYGNRKIVHVSGDVPISIIDHYVAGYGSKNKHLSSYALNENNNFLEGVLDGYLDGDGHYEKENDRYRIGFALNRELEYDLRLICNRLGYNMRAFLSHATETKSGKVFPAIRGEIRKKRSGHHNQKDDYEIKHIEETMGISYEIEVDSEDHLFTLIDGTLTHNSNAMPSSVRDRFSNKWEYVFFFTKSQKYYFDLDSIRKPLAKSSIKRISQENIPNQFKSGKSSEFAETNPVNNIPKIMNNMHQKYQQEGAYKGSHSGYINEDGSLRVNLSGANPGDILFDDTIYDPYTDPNIWDAFIEYLEQERPELLMPSILDIPTMPHSFAHFAVFPETLVNPLIKVGCPSEVCVKCGKPKLPFFIDTGRYYDHGTGEYSEYHTRETKRKIMDANGISDSSVFNTELIKERVTKWIPSCNCNAGFEPGTVLDPFAGSGTVGVVAKKQGKSAILTEISPEYAEIIKNRLEIEASGTNMNVKFVETASISSLEEEE